ncbi:MAG: hypothetical protein ACI835_001460 [Planctomycetota bacterium]|jgi:hypothetical protein
MNKRLLLSLALIPLASGCVGVRSSGDQHTVHAEAFHLLGLTIPGDENPKAWAKVPEGAEVITVRSSPSDWTSVVGVLSNLFGFSSTEITWKGAPPVGSDASGAE